MPIIVTSYLFTDADVFKDTAVQGNLTTGFNLTAFRVNDDLRALMDSVSATLLQKGSLLPWMNLEYAFQKFLPLDAQGLANVTVDLLGYSAYLDCEIMSPQTTVSTRLEITYHSRSTAEGVIFLKH